MKISLKNSLIILSAALAILFTGCASTPKGLTPSQAVGANHSPAALYMITFSDNAKDFPEFYFVLFFFFESDVQARKNQHPFVLFS